MTATKQPPTASEKLRTFFAEGVNQTTRERIFFSRLSFDVKIAAARTGYHLHIYEPDVDRDGFDIVAEDEDSVGWYQTKAVLSSVATGSWDILVDFLRPALSDAGDYAYDPVEAGRGGGVILIEIDDTTTDGAVQYGYTDFSIITAIAEGFIAKRPNKGAGRPAEPARTAANTVLRQLRDWERTKKVTIPKQLFIAARDSDALLGLMGMRSTGEDYGRFMVKQALGFVRLDASGRLEPNLDIAAVAHLYEHMKSLCGLQATVSKGARLFALFHPFTWKSAPPSA